jgi:integrase
MDDAEVPAAGEERTVVTEVVQQGGGGVSRPRGRPPGKTTKARGVGRLYRRGKIWWVQYSWEGQLFRESSESKVRARAGDLLKRRLAEISRGRRVGPQVEKTTFDELAKMLVDDYVVNSRKSLDRAERSIEHLREVFGRSRALDITPDRVSAYIRSRLDRAQPGTVRLELAALGRMFTLGVRAGKVPHRPYLPSVEVRNTRTGFFEEAELRAVLSHLPADLRPLIEFVHLTGWRIGEARSLTWPQVDFGAGTVRLEPGTTKNDEAREFPFVALPPLEALLHAQAAHTRAIERERGQVIAPVFHRAGKPIKSMHGAWRRACERAGVAGRLIHDLRRTAVRNLERAGVSRSVAMQLTGHKTESIYRRYAIVSVADLRDGVGKLAALHAGSPVAPRGVVALFGAEKSRRSTEEAQIAQVGPVAGDAPSA